LKIKNIQNKKDCKIQFFSYAISLAGSHRMTRIIFQKINLLTKEFSGIALIFLLISCRPADPFFRLKPLMNIEYTGFISRDFFQVVVNVDMTTKELPINGLRASCKNEANKKKDQVTIEYLKKNYISRKIKDNPFAPKKDQGESKDFTTNIQMKDTDESKKTEKEKGKPSPEFGLYNKTNYQLTRGEFAWFLDAMFLYREDYSNPEKCIFVYRIIEDGLYKKVEATNILIEEQEKSEKKEDL